MQSTIQKDLKTKVDELEKTLLAITNVNDIQMENMCSGAPVVNSDHTAYLLDFLIEPAMYQVEALRVLIHGLQMATEPELAAP